MLLRLWSDIVGFALDSPALAFLLLIALSFGLAAIVTLGQARREARRSRLTTAAALRRDAHTPARRERLRLLQDRHSDRRAS